MRIFQINGGVFGSTGKIMFDLAEVAQKQGYEVLCASPITSTNRNRQPKQPYYQIGTYYGRCLNVLLARLTGLEGCFAVLPTWKLLRKIDEFRPDVLHIHSIHNSYLNIPMLFRYIKRKNLRVVWTLHDCWALTGHCAYFDAIGCEKWKTGCHDCPQYVSYPKSYLDNSRVMHWLKKQWFCGVRDMTIVTPSQWLAGLVEQSFLGDYPVRVINNGIDLNVFKPTQSNFREKHNIGNRYIVLGVAFGWNKNKGLDTFVELARRLDDSYKIILVGTDEQVEKQLPENILAIRRTQNQQELAEIYTAADVFVNPTREDNYPTVNMEAIACGTPVVTFNTGGSPEMLDENCGTVVDKDDVNALIDQLVSICAEGDLWKKNCVERATIFNAQKKYEKVVKLYEYGV